MRTEQEILDRISAIPYRLFDHEKGDLACYLSFDGARPFLTDEATTESWKPLIPNPDAAVERMREYMPFAWEKANDERGLSAMRSLQHLKAWAFISCDAAAFAMVNPDDYSDYGKDQLDALCAHFGWPSEREQSS